MSRKRRVFDIDLPDDPLGHPAGDPVDVTPQVDTPHRRGRMASAISENAEALHARKSTTEAIREENDALAHEYVARRDAGGVVEQIGLDDVHTYMLVRDRFPGDDLELESLVTSIRELGLSNPIRVLTRPDGAGWNWCRGIAGFVRIAPCWTKPAMRGGPRSPRWF
jgi:ParB family chromosome partitioning protein